jgi:hypothetical protein
MFPLSLIGQLYHLVQLLVEMGVSELIARADLELTLPISASQVAAMTRVSYQYAALHFTIGKTLTDIS